MDKAGCCWPPRACTGPIVPMSNNERSNAPTTRLASLASLIYEFTFLFFRCRDEGATRDDSSVLAASITEGRSRNLKIWPYIPAELRFYITLTLGPSIKYSGRNKFETIERSEE